MTEIKNLFFNDKLRSIISGLTLLVVLIMVSLNYWFPRKNTIDKETVRILQEVTIQIEKAANSLHKQSELTDKANKELTRQLEEMEHDRYENYKELLERYGVGVPDYTNNDYSKLIEDMLASRYATNNNIIDRVQ